MLLLNSRAAVLTMEELQRTLSLKPRFVGEAAWLLFRLQLVLFVVGAASSAVALLSRA